MSKWLSSFWPRGEKLAHGYRDAKYILVAVACLGELLQGGLVFGWNALALMLTARGTYSEKCTDLAQRELSLRYTDTCVYVGIRTRL